MPQVLTSRKGNVLGEKVNGQGIAQNSLGDSLVGGAISFQDKVPLQKH
jgi:hypothetical protein